MAKLTGTHRSYLSLIACGAMAVSFCGRIHAQSSGEKILLARAQAHMAQRTWPDGWVDSKCSIECKNAGSKLEYECTNWAAQSIQECAQWADEGSNQCTSWKKCHWYTPWNCIAGFFCRAWYWVASWVCIAFMIVTVYACLVFGWVVVKIVCPVLWLTLDLICLGVTLIWCGLLAIAKAIGNLFGRDPGIARIDHIFVLMLENRAFDHMLGFSGITGVDLEGNPTVFNDGFSTSLGNFDPATNTSPTCWAKSQIGRSRPAFTKNGLCIAPCGRLNMGVSCTTP